MTNVAVAITCFNRCQKTLAALHALFAAVPPGVALKVFLTDDGSNDGTADAINAAFPDAVTLLTGDGSLFWNRGMHLALEHAYRTDADFYLWLNDDTVLHPGALSALLETHQQLLARTGAAGIVVGATSSENGTISYGGRGAPQRGRPTRFPLLPVADTPQPCHTFNGNCVLVAREVAQRLGNLDPGFRHAIGDLDYGLRARQLGIAMWVNPGFIGICNNDHKIDGSYFDTRLPLSVRWKKMMSPKGLPPSSWAIFCRRHVGVVWPLFWAWPYVRLVLSSARRKQVHGAPG